MRLTDVTAKSLMMKPIAKRRQDFFVAKAALTAKDAVILAVIAQPKPTTNRQHKEEAVSDRIRLFPLCID